MRRLLSILLCLILLPLTLRAQDTSDDDQGYSPWLRVVFCGASVGFSAGAGSILARPEGDIASLLISVVLANFGGYAARPCLYGEDTRVLSGFGRFCDETVLLAMPWVGVGVGINHVDQGSTVKMAVPILAAGVTSTFLRHRACTALPGSQP